MNVNKNINHFFSKLSYDFHAFNNQTTSTYRISLLKKHYAFFQ